MKWITFFVMWLAFNGQLHAQIEPVYDGTNGIRNRALSMCLTCHATTVTGGARRGAPSPPNYDTYAEAIINADITVERAVGGSMPPSGFQPLTTEQKNALLAWQKAGFPERAAVVVADTQAPTAPSGLAASAVSTSAINLAWVASTDNVGVTAYKVFRGGSLIATLGNVTSYGDAGLNAATTYSYTVAACDAAGNCSPNSASASATTQPIVVVNPNQQQDCFFSFAESSYPTVFAPPAPSLSVPPYYYRFYAPGTYLGIASGKLLYYGPLSSNTLVDLGDITTWYQTARCN